MGSAIAIDPDVSLWAEGLVHFLSTAKRLRRTAQGCFNPGLVDNE